MSEEGLPPSARKLQVLRWLEAFDHDETFTRSNYSTTPTVANLTAFMIEEGCFRKCHPYHGSFDSDQELFEDMQANLSRLLRHYAGHGLITRIGKRTKKSDDRDLQKGYREEIRSVYWYAFNNAGANKAERLEKRFKKRQEDIDMSRIDHGELVLPVKERSRVRTRTLELPDRPADPPIEED